MLSGAPANLRDTLLPQCPGVSVRPLSVIYVLERVSNPAVAAGSGRMPCT